MPLLCVHYKGDEDGELTALGAANECLQLERLRGGGVVHDVQPERAVQPRGFQDAGAAAIEIAGGSGAGGRRDAGDGVGITTCRVTTRIVQLEGTKEGSTMRGHALSRRLTTDPSTA